MSPKPLTLIACLIILISLTTSTRAPLAAASDDPGDTTVAYYLPLVSYTTPTPTYGWAGGITWRADYSNIPPELLPECTHNWGPRPSMGEKKLAALGIVFIPATRAHWHNERFHRYNDSDMTGPVLVDNEPDRPFEDNQTPEEFADFYYQFMTEYPGATPVIGNISHTNPSYLYQAEQFLIRKYGQTFASMTRDGNIIWGLHFYGSYEDMVVYIEKWNRVHNPARYPIWLTEFNTSDMDVGEVARMVQWLEASDIVDRYFYYTPIGDEGRFPPLIQMTAVGRLLNARTTPAAAGVRAYP